MRRRIGRWRSAALELAAAGLVAATLALPGARGALAAGVVGDGTPGSCTEAALAAAASGGGLVTFNCGPAPVTITLSAPLDISAPETTIDGGGQVTLRGGGGRIIRHRTYGLIGSSVLTLTNLTITGGRATGAGREANGGAIQSVFEAARPEYRPTLNVINVTFLDNDATLTSFSSGDSYDYGGGAIFTQGGTLNVVNSTFSGNDAANAAGGAIHGLQSSISIEKSTFTDNSAIGNAPEHSQGGAIYVDGLNAPVGGFFRITGSTFRDNTAYNTGGAIYVNMYEDSNRFTVDQSSFVNNAVVGGARAQGGAIGGGSTANGAGTGNAAIMITRSLFAGNSATKSGTPQDGSGGALSFPQRAVLTIENSTFVGNTAFGTSYNANGGALYIVNQATPFQITNSTFANNHAGWVGGAISSAQIGEAPGGAVRNTLFSNNTADNGPNHWKIQQHCSSELTDTGGNFQYPPRLTNADFDNDVTCFAGKSAPGQTGLPVFRDPKLAPLADNGGPTQTMAIGADSPAFDSGVAAGCPGVDQRGVPRPQGARCDSGAYERVLALSAVPGLVGVGEPGFTLTVRGEGFTAASTVLWDGDALPTTFASAAELRAVVAAARLSTPRRVAITVSGSALPAATVIVAARVVRAHLPAVAR
jgi:hypothetical protein